MKKLLLVSLLAFSGTSMACSAHDGVSDTTARLAPVLLAHAGHTHTDAGHEHSAHGTTAGHGAAGNPHAVVSKTLNVSSCWIRSLPVPTPSAGYFVVKNTGDKGVKLQSASSPVYGVVMLHETSDKGGMSKMSMAHDIDIAAGGELAFKPGGYHAMLEKPTEVPAIGSNVSMDFFFDNGEKTTALCEVKPAKTLAR